MDDRPPYHYWSQFSPQVLIDAADSYDELATEPDTKPEEVTELHAIAAAIRHSVSLRREIVFT